MNRKFNSLSRFVPFILFVVLCIALLVLHGLKLFDVDSISVALLVLIAIPVIGQFVESISISGNEIRFKELNQLARFFVFLESISEERRWTFYPSRQGESNLGEGLGILVGELLKTSRQKTIAQLSQWLKSKNENTKWFAAEIIGYFRIEELKEDVKYFQFTDKNLPWEYWKLNCLWAYSRFNNYRELTDMLLNTTDKNNQVWVVEAISQMIEAENCRNLFIESIEKFVNRNDIDEKLKIKASALLN
jgi:hypothetical protein